MFGKYCKVAFVPLGKKRGTEREREIHLIVKKLGGRQAGWGWAAEYRSGEGWEEGMGI